MSYITLIMSSHLNFRMDITVKLINNLSTERSNSYQSWLDVGRCLRGISYDFLDHWITFSRKSTKFEDGKCEFLWESQFFSEILPNKHNLDLLHSWAKFDNENGYSIIMNHYYDYLISSLTFKPINETFQSRHFAYLDFAYIFYKMHAHEIKYVSDDDWYLMINNIWTNIDTNDLKNLFIQSLIDEFTRLKNYFHRDNHKIINNCLGFLEDGDFNDDIMYHCADHFRFEKFKLEKNKTKTNTTSQVDTTSPVNTTSQTDTTLPVNTISQTDTTSPINTTSQTDTKKIAYLLDYMYGNETDFPLRSHDLMLFSTKEEAELYSNRKYGKNVYPNTIRIIEMIIDKANHKDEFLIEGITI